MACLVCGLEGTVKSHIIPRGVFRLMKGSQAKVLRTRRGDTGWDESQSGFYDDRILCKEHEARLGKFDDYGVRFCRYFKIQADRGISRISVPNPLPERLVGFAAAVVWRMAASRTDLKPEEMLGPMAKQIEDLLFNDVAFDPLLLLSRNAYAVDGKPFEMTLLPIAYTELDRQFRRFITCGIIFDLKVDERPAPPPMAVLAANTQTAVTLYEDFPLNPLREPGFRHAILAMGLPRRPHHRKLQR